MLRHSRYVILCCVAVTLLFACNKVPDHRRYIPKDAALVAGIDLKSLGKTIAWNMITGSKLFKEMEKKVPQKNGTDIMSGLGNAGIDALNTFYVYLKTDKRFNSGIKVTALVPLSNSGDWETYIKKNFSQAAIKKHNDIQTASLGKDMFVGWNNHLLIIINATSASSDEATSQPATAPVDMEMELDAAFSITNDNSIISDKNFTKLENSGHDITLWINYEEIMSQYGNEGMASRMGGVSLAPAIWKGTAFACGFDFKKGKITGDLTYYSSKEMSEVYKEFGATNASKEMVERLPAKDLDMLLAMHLSPKGIKDMLTKTDMLGLANAGLASVDDMDIDKLLDAFTGDIAFTMNSLSVERASGNYMEEGMPEQTTRAGVCYVMKINKQENFQKIMDIAAKTGMMLPDTRNAATKGFVVPINARDSFYILIQYPYVTVSNKYPQAKAVIEGGDKNDKLPANVLAQVTGHPIGLYFDIQQSIQKFNVGNPTSEADSILYAESRKLLTDFALNGGEFKDGAMQTHMEVNFTNKDESSIIVLLNYGMKITEALEKAKEKEMEAPQAQPY